MPRAAKPSTGLNTANSRESEDNAGLYGSRFLPGLRTAIPIACAYADMRPLKFSLLHLTSSISWAIAILLLVKGGASTLAALGVHSWWGPFIPAAFIVIFFRWLARPARPRTPNP